jgi:hypothetical protein
MKYLITTICIAIIILCFQFIASRQSSLIPHCSLEIPNSIGLYTGQPNHLLEIRDSIGNYFGLDVHGDSIISCGTLKPDSAAKIFFQFRSMK